MTETVTSLFNAWNKDYQAISDRTDQLVFKGYGLRDVRQTLEAEFPGYQKSQSWVESIMRPIADQIKQAGGFTEVEVLGPMGIQARVSLHCYKDSTEEIINSITLMPELDNSSNEAILYKEDCTTDTQEFKPGTIGAINDMNHPRLPIPNETAGHEWLKYLD